MDYLTKPASPDIGQPASAGPPQRQLGTSINRMDATSRAHLEAIDRISWLYTHAYIRSSASVAQAQMLRQAMAQWEPLSAEKDEQLLDLTTVYLRNVTEAVRAGSRHILADAEAASQPAPPLSFWDWLDTRFGT